MQKSLSPKQVARAIGVSESSLKRWCDQGVIPFDRTEGGHRRIRLPDVLQFLRDTQRTLVEPEVLGLPRHAGRGERTLSNARNDLTAALVAGDEEVCRQIVLSLYLAEHPISSICDKVIADSCHDIGDLWECNDLEVYRERRSVEICSRILTEIRFMLPKPAADAPTAIGATPEGDPYQLANRMGELVLRQAGWKAVSLGSSLPVATLRSAIIETQPALFWLSVSVVPDPQIFLQQYSDLYDEFSGQCAFVVGGAAITEGLRQEMRYSAYCDTMQHLESFVATYGRQLETTQNPV